MRRSDGAALAELAVLRLMMMLLLLLLLLEPPFFFACSCLAASFFLCFVFLLLRRQWHGSGNGLELVMQCDACFMTPMTIDKILPVCPPSVAAVARLTTGNLPLWLCRAIMNGESRGQLATNSSGVSSKQCRTDNDVRK